MLEWINQDFIHEITSTQRSTTSAHSPASLPNREDVQKGLNLPHDCSVPEFCFDVVDSWFWCGQDAILSQEERPTATAFHFHPVQTHQFLQLLLFPLLFQTLLLFSPLPLPMRDVLSGGAEGQSLGGKTLGKEEWPESWAANVANSPWCAGGHGSCTKKTSVSAVSHLPPADSQISIPHHCLSGKEPRMKNCMKVFIKDLYEGLYDLHGRQPVVVRKITWWVSKWRKGKGTREQRHSNGNQSYTQPTFWGLPCKNIYRYLDGTFLKWKLKYWYIHHR